MKNNFRRGLRRAVCLMLICICPILCLTGCHGARESASFTVPETFDTGRNYTITFWAKNDTNINQTNVYKQAIEDFQALYPNIQVDLRLYTDYGRIYNDVITNISTGTTPNVCITYPDHIATYLTGDNSVVALDELFAHEKYGFGGSELNYDGSTLEEMIPEFLSECVISGKHYAVPYMRSTEACYVNVTLLNSLGYELPETLTWDFVWEVSEAAAQKDEDGVYLANGQKTMIPFIYKSTDNMMIQLLRQLGAGYSTDDGEIQIFNDDTKSLLYDISSHAKSGAFSTFKISSYPANFLNAGQCIFAVDSTAGATWMGTYAPLSDISEDKFTEFETAVMTIPQIDPENPQMISQGPSMCIFNKEDPQEVLASWLFAQYMLTNKVQIGYASTEGYLPVTSKAQQSAEYQSYLSRMGEDNDEHYDVKIKASRLLMENMENTFVTPVFNGSASLRDASGQLIEETVKATRRKKTVDEAFMEELFTDVSSLFRLDQIESASDGSDAEADLSPLSGTARALIACIIAAWLMMAAYLCAGLIRKRYREQGRNRKAL